MREIKKHDKYLCKVDDYKDGYFTKGNIYVVEIVNNEQIILLTDVGFAYTLDKETLNKDFTDLQEESKSEIATPKYDFINPEHYKKGSKEVIDMMLDIWGVEKLIAHCEMCAFKYRMRIGNKPNQPIEQDLKKAIWYENKAKELKNN